MTSHIKSDHYRRGLELAEAGRHQEALEHIRLHLGMSPNDAEALNDTGAILHCLGRTDEAIEHFIKAKTLKSDSGEILWNLSEAYIAGGRAKEAMYLFDDMEQIGVLSADVLNRTANVFLQQNDKANALEMLLRSLSFSPGQEVLTPIVQVIRSKRPRIAFFCGGDGMTFLREIIEFAERRFEVRVFEGQTEDELYELMQWSDISWFEWCTNLAVAASKKPKVCRNIVRLHRYEAYERWPAEVNWRNIDILVTVGNPVTLATLRGRAAGLESQTSISIVPNGVNLKKFPFVEKPRGKNIAFLGNLRLVKNPMLMLQCMQKLHYMDGEYRLFFGGAFQDEVLEQYLRKMVDVLGLGDAVFFDGWQSDVADWLGDKHYIVSTSICEGHPVGILEGMACGLKPVVHNFLGAGQMLPSEFLFNISEEFCDQVLSERYEPRRYREFVESRYSLARQLRRINAIFSDLEAEINSEGDAEAGECGVGEGEQSSVLPSGGVRQCAPVEQR
ncbi:MAG: glycosyltransferase [Sedimentisphaerales bacterium]|nr:glycosyltransferase [Sedimentisphaerales bacterium]